MTDSIRTRSDDRKLRGYGIQSDSQSKDSNRIPRVGNPGRVGTGREVSSTAQRIEAWVAENLPGEDSYAVSAVQMHLRKSGRAVTAAAVLEQLKARGWAREQRS